MNELTLLIGSGVMIIFGLIGKIDSMSSVGLGLLWIYIYIVTQ